VDQSSNKYPEYSLKDKFLRSIDRTENPPEYYRMISPAYNIFNPWYNINIQYNIINNSFSDNIINNHNPNPYNIINNSYSDNIINNHNPNPYNIINNSSSYNITHYYPLGSNILPPEVRQHIHDHLSDPNPPPPEVQPDIHNSPSYSRQKSVPNRQVPENVIPKDSLDPSIDMTCPICLEEFQDTVFKTTCQHYFCLDCWEEYRSCGKPECPMCREDLRAFSSKIEI